MRVKRWGNSLHIRLPAAVVEALTLKEGDKIELRVTGERVFEIARDQRHAEALARVRALRRPLPANSNFDRDEANKRSQ